METSKEANLRTICPYPSPWSSCFKFNQESHLRTRITLLCTCLKIKKHSLRGCLWGLHRRNSQSGSIVRVRIIKTQVGSFDPSEPWSRAPMRMLFAAFSPTSHLSQKQQLHILHILDSLVPALCRTGPLDIELLLLGISKLSISTTREMYRDIMPSVGVGRTYYQCRKMCLKQIPNSGKGFLAAGDKRTKMSD